MKHALPQDREACACTTLRGLARRATAVYDRFLEPAGLMLTQYGVLAKLDRLLVCNLSELAKACELDVTSLSRGLRSLINAGLVRCGKGKDDRTKRYELTAKGKQALQRAFPLWKRAQKRVHGVIPQGQIEVLEGLASALRTL